MLCGSVTRATSVVDFGLLGLLIDWFPFVHGGLHVGGVVGLAAARYASPTSLSKDDDFSNGVGLALLGGYDFWIGPQWSLGALARLAAGWTRWSGPVTIDGSRGEVEETDATTSFSLMFTWLHH